MEQHLKRPRSAVRRRRRRLQIIAVVLLTPPLAFYEISDLGVRQVAFDGEGRYLAIRRQDDKRSLREVATGWEATVPWELQGWLRAPVSDGTDSGPTAFKRENGWGYYHFQGAPYKKENRWGYYVETVFRGWVLAEVREIRITPDRPGADKVWRLYAHQAEVTAGALWCPKQLPPAPAATAGDSLSDPLTPPPCTLASASRDRTVRLWEVPTDWRGEKSRIVLQERRTLAHAAPVTGVAFSPDGRLVASGSEDGFVRVWDVSGGQTVRQFPRHGAAITCLAFSPDGRLIASADAHGVVRMWSLADGNEVWRTAAGRSKLRLRRYFSFDSLEPGVRAGPWLVLLWGIACLLLGLPVLVFVLALARYGGLVRAVALNPDGTLLGILSPRDVFLLHTASGRELWSEATGADLGRRCAIAFPDAAWAKEPALAEGRGAKEYYRSLESGHLLQKDSRPYELAAAAKHPLLGRGVPNQRDIPMILWRLYWGLRESISSLAFSPAKGILASGRTDGKIGFWEISSASDTLITGHDGSVASLAFSADGCLLASGSEDSMLRLWDVASRTERACLTEHTAGVTSVAFSPDGTLLASSSADATVRVWKAATGREVLRLEGHTAKVNSVAFSPDGQFIVSGSDDKTVRAWDTATGALLWRLVAKRVGVFGVRFERS